MPNYNYEDIIGKVESLPWCALVTTGRVGTDFFQSLLDSHPEVFVFNGILFFYNEFWDKSYCVKYPGDADVNDMAEEFTGNYIWKLKSKYDYEERKDELGENMDQSINIDTAIFREHLTELLKIRPVTSRSFLQAVYVSYSLSLGQDIRKKTIFFHHVHHISKLKRYLNDFPDSKVISMTRDPRATYVSGVEHWIEYDSERDHLKRAFKVLKRTILDAHLLRTNSINLRILKLEDTGNDEILYLICDWLGIEYNNCLKKSTWAGLRWWGDRISLKKATNIEIGFSSTMIKNNWEKKLPKLDKALLNYLISDRLSWLSYEKKKSYSLIYHVLMFIIIPFPTVYERRYLSPLYIYSIIASKKKMRLKRILWSFYYYPIRVIYYYNLYFRKMIGKRYDLPFFKI